MYRFLLEKRGSELCAICGQPETKASPKDGQLFRLHVDHDHATGLLRDLLCGHCNSGLGFYREDPALLRRAAEYLEHHLALPSDVRYVEEMVNAPTGTVHPFDLDPNGAPLSLEVVPVPSIDGLTEVEGSAIPEVQARPSHGGQST